MTSLETFREILKECQVEVPEDSLEMFRDLIDMQADMILDKWSEERQNSKGVE